MAASIITMIVCIALNIFGMYVTTYSITIRDIKGKKRRVSSILMYLFYHSMIILCAVYLILIITKDLPNEY